MRRARRARFPITLPHQRGAPRVSGLARVSPRHGGALRGVAWVRRGARPCGRSWTPRRGVHGAVAAFGHGVRDTHWCRVTGGHRDHLRPVVQVPDGRRGRRRAWSAELESSGEEVTSVLVLGLQILGPSLVFASGVYHEGRTQHDQRVRARVWPTAVTPVAGAARGAVIVVDHRRQAACAAAAPAEAADARQSLQGLDATVADVVACVRERDPGLTEHEALDRVIDAWRARAADREDQLTGRPRYRAVSTLGGVGTAGTAGPGLREQSPLMRALEGTWDDRDGRRAVRCDHTALATVSAAAECPPSCPVPHDARAACAFRAGDDAWRQHGDRALEILRHITRIAGHPRHHAEVDHCLRSRLEQQPCLCGAALRARTLQDDDGDDGRQDTAQHEQPGRDRAGHEATEARTQSECVTKDTL